MNIQKRGNFLIILVLLIFNCLYCESNGGGRNNEVNNDENKLFYFVDLKNGHDLNQGIKDKPFKNLEYAINYINKNHHNSNKSISIIVSKGVYNFKSKIVLGNKNSISIYGDYTGYPMWRRDTLIKLPYKSETVINSKDSNAIEIIDSIFSITLSHLSILTSPPKPVTRVPVSVFKESYEITPSSYGIIISDSENVSLKFLSIESSDAANGYSPFDYQYNSIYEGKDGKHGSSGCENGQYSDCLRCKLPKFGSGGLAPKCINDYKNDLSAGGNGGKPGKGDHIGEFGKNGTNNGSQGGRGSKSSLMYLDPFSIGANGTNGLNGSNGKVTRLQFTPNGIFSFKQVPKDGMNGRGGGGGGGAGGSFNNDGRCAVYGGSGAGGGSGGCGGRAAKSGGSGGSSIGIYIYNSKSISIEFCDIKSGNGGDGGKSSKPELGYRGGRGGFSVTDDYEIYPQGGYGGSGGKGGDGGYASGGSGGLSIPIVVYSNSLPIQKCNNYIFSSMGKGGLSPLKYLNGNDGLERRCLSISDNENQDDQIKCPDYSTQECIQSLINVNENCEYGEIKDEFNICGGNGSLSINSIGCDGILNSGKIFDICGVCGGSNTTCFIGCDGVINSTKTVDLCGVCGGSNSTCLMGCDGVLNSTKVYDLCGVCDGTNTTCLIGCDGVVNSTKKFDLCGVCGGSNSTCLIGCDGVPHSYKVFDSCGVCGGDDTKCDSKKQIKLMKTSTKVIISGCIVCVSVYGGITALYFFKKRLKAKGSQYYRTKLILEYQDSPIIQTELIKPNYESQNPQPHQLSNNINNLGIWPGSPYPNHSNNSGISSLFNSLSPNHHQSNNNNYKQFNNNEYNSDDENEISNQIQIDQLNTSTSNLSYPITNNNLDNNNEDNYNDYNSNFINSNLSYINYSDDSSSSSSSNDNLSYISHINR